MHLSRRLRGQGGFTVVETLVAMIVLGVVAAGAMMMIQIVLRQGNGVVERTDAMQRGRIALDLITRQIRSQVCLDGTTGSMVQATGASLTFYGDLGDGSTPPARRTLAFDPVTRRITETVYQGSGPATGPVTFPAQPTRKAVLMQDVVADGGAPLFSYYAFSSSVPPTPTAALTAPVSGGALSRVAMIRVRFAVRPTGGRDDRFATRMQDDIFLRTADPNSSRPDPTCR